MSLLIQRASHDFLSLPRSRRHIITDAPERVLNKTSGHFVIFARDDSCRRFCRLLDLAATKHDVRIVALSITLNHWPRRLIGNKDKMRQWRRLG